MGTGKRYLMVVAAVLVVTACASAPPSHQGRRSVAVWELEDLSPMPEGRPDLGELLSVKVMEVARQVPDWTVVEREQLLLALEELNLGTTALVDESTRLRLGGLVGAHTMVFGGYQVVGDFMRLDLRLVEVETGKILKTATRTTPATGISGWLRAAEEAARELF